MKQHHDECYHRLCDYIKVTENLLLKAIKKYDNNGYCKIIPSFDLCIPYDAIRLAGGFPTGVFVNWQCQIPFIPIDTTLNAGLGSVFELKSDNGKFCLSEKMTNRLLSKFSKDEVYNLNFDRGNHFIVYAKSQYSNKSFLILHSSASEFSKKWSGLYPSQDSWYSKHINSITEGNRYLRYITGDVAEKYIKKYNMARIFCELRHEDAVNYLIEGQAEVVDCKHYHHYGMIGNSSITIGCYCVEANDNIVIFSAPGKPIFLAKSMSSHHSYVVGSKAMYIFPHGWGKIIKDELNINLAANSIILNGISFNTTAFDSLYSHPEIVLRDFSLNEKSDRYFFDCSKEFFQVNIIDIFNQIASFSINGFEYWSSTHEEQVSADTPPP